MPGITDPAQPHFKGGLWGWDLSQWRRLAQIFGYTDRWVENLGGTKSGAGLYSVDGTAVPSGYVYVVQALSLGNMSGARGALFLKVISGATVIGLGYIATPVQYQAVISLGVIVLKEGDAVRVQQLACLDGDVLQGGVWGYKMAIAE